MHSYKVSYGITFSYLTNCYGYSDSIVVEVPDHIHEEELEQFFVDEIYKKHKDQFRNFYDDIEIIRYENC